MEGEIKILMVEDDPFFSKLCARALEEAGFSIFLAGDGEQGLEKIKSEDPDLILLDIILPKMNGFDVLKRIREDSDPKIAGKPVIILSNLYAREEEEKGKQLRANDYLIKANTNSYELVNKINGILGKK
jgi:DNA-binding response OmpR family regulator